MSIKIIKGSYSTIIDSSTLSANQTITFPDTSGTVMVTSGTGGNLLDMFYPVGTIYMSADANFNPNTSWGGTWAKIENRFLLGSGTNKIVGTTGGEENVTLTTNQLPKHQHTLGEMNITGDLHYAGGSSLSTTGAFFSNGTSFGYYHGTSGTQYGRAGLDATKTWEGSSSTVGNDESHNNMPPYEVVNIWKRTA